MTKFFLLIIPFYTLFGYSQNEDSVRQEINQVQQLISFSQFNTIDNPANAGIQDRNISLSTFTNIAKPTYMEVHNYIGVDGYVNKKFALGLYYTLDNWNGSLLQNSLGLVLKKQFNHIHVGLGIEKNTLRLLSNGLTYGDMIDPRKGLIYPTFENTTNTNVTKTLNFKPEVLYLKGKWQIGLGLNHINGENNSLKKGFSSVPLETNVTASYLVTLNNKTSYVPMLKIKHTKLAQEVALHQLFIYKLKRHLHLINLSYALNKNVGIKYGLSLNNRLKLGVQYYHPIYYSDYFPKSILINVQYLFRKK